MGGPGNQEERQLKIAGAESQGWKGSERERYYLSPLPVQGSELAVLGWWIWVLAKKALTCNHWLTRTIIYVIQFLNCQF